MEKCTYCVQRISRGAPVDAKLAGRAARRTATSRPPASRPARPQAIVFGDMRDAEEPRSWRKARCRANYVAARRAQQPAAHHATWRKRAQPATRSWSRRERARRTMRSRGPARVAHRAAGLLATGCCRGCTLVAAADPPQPQHGRPAEATSRRRRATSSTTAPPCGRRSPGTVARGELREDSAFFDGQGRRRRLRRRDRRWRRRRGRARARRQRFGIYCAPCHDAARRRQGHPLPARQGADRVDPHATRLPRHARRPALRRDHQRRRPDARLPLADPGRPTAGRSSPTCASCRRDAGAAAGGSGRGRRRRARRRRRRRRSSAAASARRRMTSAVGAPGRAVTGKRSPSPRRRCSPASVGWRVR